YDLTTGHPRPGANECGTDIHSPLSLTMCSHTRILCSITGEQTTNLILMANRKNITIKDIARMSGVSAGTVDRVLHNRGRVSEEALRKVLAVLEQIDY